VRIASSGQARHFVVRAHAGELFPDALLDLVRMHEIRAGWATGHGVFADVEKQRAIGEELLGVESSNHWDSRFGRWVGVTRKPSS
jgi:hypothetical protein